MSFFWSIETVSGHQRLQCIAGFPSYARGHREMVTRQLYLDQSFIRAHLWFLMMNSRLSGIRCRSNQPSQLFFPSVSLRTAGIPLPVGSARTTSRSSGEREAVYIYNATVMMRKNPRRGCCMQRGAAPASLTGKGPRDVFLYWSQWLEPSPLQATEGLAA